MDRENRRKVTLNELSHLLKEARKTKEQETGQKITHKMIAEAIGVDRTTVGKWEQGERSPSFLNVLDYCHFLGITLDELVGLKQQQTLYLELTEEERDTMLAMIGECVSESENSNRYHKLHTFEQYLKAFLGRARTK